MSNEIRTGFTSGNTLSAVVRRRADAYVWYPAGGVWETFGGGAGRTNSDYDIALADKGGDYYVGDFDANIIEPELYDLVLLVGGVFAGIQQFNWDGTQRDESYKHLAVGAGYVGDYRVNGNVVFTWESGQVTASGGSVRVYKDGNISQVTVPTGITETIDFDGMAGMHRVEIDLSANSFYSKDSDYSVVRKDVTVSGQAVTLVIAAFSIENRYEHKPFNPGG